MIREAIILACMTSFAAPVCAANFKGVNLVAERGARVTGYYLLPQSSVRPLLADRRQLFLKLSNLAALAVGEVVNLPDDDRYYFFPQCDGVVKLREQLIPPNQESLELSCA
jgi:hypothetical protein